MAGTTITVDEAREILETPGYDAYGTLRIYGVLEDGQIVGIKSTYYLDRHEYVEVYTKTNDGTGMPPIRKAN